MKEHGVIEIRNASITNTFGRAEVYLGRQSSGNRRNWRYDNGVEARGNPRASKDHYRSNLVARNLGPPDLAVAEAHFKRRDAKSATTSSGTESS